MSNDTWQEYEGGPMVPRTCKHPWENRAFWRKQLRVFILQRDPICRICQKRASAVVDHIKPFIAPDGTVSWVLFSSPENLRGLCAPCHNTATATYDRGFGNAPKAGKEDHIAVTGEDGQQYKSSTIDVRKLNELIPQNADDIAALLSGIPDL